MMPAYGAAPAAYGGFAPGGVPSRGFAGAPMGAPQQMARPMYQQGAPAQPYGAAPAGYGAPAGFPQVQQPQGMPQPQYAGAPQPGMQQPQGLQQWQPQPAPLTVSALPVRGSQQHQFPQQQQQQQQQFQQMAAPAPQAAMPPPQEAHTDAADHDFKAGDWVRLRGGPQSAYSPEYQGKVFMVEVPNVGDGRMMCKFEKSNRVVTKMYMDPLAVELVEEAPQAHELPPAYGQGPAPRQEPAAMSGRVQLSLPGTDRDGKMGWVIAPGLPDAQGNVKVQMDGENTIVDVPPSYLQQIQGAPMDGVCGHLRTGEAVEILNMKPADGATNHNGRTGVVETLDPSSGAIVVLLDQAVHGTARLSLNPAYLKSLETGMTAPPVQHNLKPIIPHQPQMPSGAPVGHHVGDMVRVKGLASRPQHDGKVGVVKQMTADGLLVELQGESTSLILNSSYLEAC